VNWSADEVADCDPATVTVTSTCPVPAGDVAVNDVALLKVTLAAGAEPKSTVAALVKPVPVTVTLVPAGPLVGLMAVTVGAAPV
jgi:hypothetical protein